MFFPLADLLLTHNGNEKNKHEGKTKKPLKIQGLI
jgi:hypothetical protein